MSEGHIRDLANERHGLIRKRRTVGLTDIEAGRLAYIEDRLERSRASRDVVDPMADIAKRQRELRLMLERALDDVDSMRDTGDET